MKAKKIDTKSPNKQSSEMRRLRIGQAKYCVRDAEDLKKLPAKQFFIPGNTRAEQKS